VLSKQYCDHEDCKRVNNDRLYEEHGLKVHYGREHRKNKGTTTRFDDFFNVDSSSSEEDTVDNSSDSEDEPTHINNEPDPAPNYFTRILGDSDPEQKKDATFNSGVPEVVLSIFLHSVNTKHLSLQT